MMLRNWVVGSTALDAAGWTLIQFLWQGTIIAAAAAVALALLRDRPAGERYAVCVLGLIAMIAAPIVTFLRIPGAPAGELPAVIAFAVPRTAVGAGGLPGGIWTATVPWLALAWLAGATTMQVRLFFQWLCVLRIRRAGAAPASRALQAVVDELRGRLEIRRVVRILESTAVAVPAVAGWLRPVVLVPRDVLAALTPAQLRAVIAHELAHIRRHDYAVNLLQNVVETLLFFHPAVWWLSSRMRREREFCCDDMAVSVCGDKLEFARALSSLDRLDHFVPQTTPAFTGGSLMDRIARLAGVRTAGSRFRVAWLAPLVLALVATTAWSAVQRGPRDVHIEKLHFDDQLMKVEVLEDFVVPLDIRLPALPALPSTPIIIPDMAIPPHIPAKIEFLHHNLEDMRIELENIALIRSRDMLEMQSMKVVRELIGGEIDSKEAVERLEALIRERDEALEKQKEERKAKEKAREKEKKKAD